MQRHMQVPASWALGASGQCGDAREGVGQRVVIESMSLDHIAASEWGEVVLTWGIYTHPWVNRGSCQLSQWGTHWHLVEWGMDAQ